MYKVLLIGPTGKIGSAVFETIIQQTEKYSVGVLIRNSSKFKCKHSNCKVFHGDILDDTLRDAVRWSDIVVNCSGVVSYKKPDKGLIHTVNVNGVKNIVRFCLEYNRPLIHSSSAIAYGSSKQPLYFSESDNMQEVYRGEYAKSKYLADQFLLNSRLSTVILRPGTLVSTLKSLYGFYSKGFIAGLDGGASFALKEEVAKAYVRAIDWMLENPGQHIFNLGGNNLRFIDVFDFFQTINDRKTRFINRSTMSFLSYLNDCILHPVFKKSIITRENYLTGNHYTFIDSTKAIKQLNYQIHPFETSLKQVLEYGDR